MPLKGTTITASTILSPLSFCGIFVVLYIDVKTTDVFFFSGISVRSPLLLVQSIFPAKVTNQSYLQMKRDAKKSIKDITTKVCTLF
jgi:hypothetical protein